MPMNRPLLTGLRILAVCFLFAVCFAVGATLSGLNKIGQQAASSQPATSSEPLAPGNPQVPRMPENFLASFLTFSVCVGIVVSYLILRSHWHGWTLAGAIFVGMYGIATVASQVESVAFLSSKLPHGMIRALFLQGVITTALFAPLAVLVLGKWRAGLPAAPSSIPGRLKAGSTLWRLAILVVVFVFLYMLFGYYVVWRNAAVQHYYGGPEFPTFFAALKYNWKNMTWIYFLAAFRALLHAGCLYPLVRMLRTSPWESALAIALFLVAWTTVLLLPNPLMPPSVAYSHFQETLGFSLVFGALAGWLLNTPRIATAEGVPAAQ